MIHVDLYAIQTSHSRLVAALSVVAADVELHVLVTGQKHVAVHDGRVLQSVERRVMWISVAAAQTCVRKMGVGVTIKKKNWFVGKSEKNINRKEETHNLCIPWV